MRAVSQDMNIVLIGMPGAGKSTVGVLLAKRTSRSFVDTDVYIQACESRRLQDILDEAGRGAFVALEETHVLALNCRRYVIATGGSVIYSEKAMDHLRRNSVTVLLDLPCETLERRIANLDSRGIVMQKGQTVCQLYRERKPLYERWADVTVACEGLNHDQVVGQVVTALGIG